MSNVRMANYESESTWKGEGAAQFETDGSQRLQTRYSGKRFEPVTQKNVPAILTFATSHCTEILWS